MIVDTFIVLVVVFCLSLYLSNDFFHPACIVSGLWMLLVGIYIYADHPLWNLSDKFSVCLLLWVMPFCVSSLLLSSKSIRVTSSTIETPFSKRRFLILYRLFVVYLCAFIGMMISTCGFSFVAYRNLMLSETLPPILMVLLYANSLFLIFFFYSIYHYRYITKKQLIILFLGTFLVILFKSNKTSILSLFVSILYLLKINHKLSIKFLMIAVSVLLFFIIAITLNRADYDLDSENGIINLIYIYTLSPLTAFDALINNEYVLNSGAPWSNTLSFFYKILNVFGADLEIGELGGYIYVPLPTNVFTTMRGFYLDGGMFGIFIMSIVLGLFMGNIYSYQKRRHVIYILFYAAIYAGLFFQHFGDYFFYSLSMIIQYYIFTQIVVRGIKMNKIKL